MIYLYWYGVFYIGGDRLKKKTTDINRYELERDDMQTAVCFRTTDGGFPAHFHSSVEMVYVRSGSITAIVDGQVYHVQAGQMVVTSGYSVHVYITEEGEHNETITMIIPMASIPSLQKVLNKKSFKEVIYDVGRDEELSVMLELLANHWEEYSVETKKGASYMVLGILITRMGLCEHPGNQRNNLMRDVLIYLQNNYQQPIRMEHLARHFGYSKSRFSRLFHDHLGCSMIEYLSTIRCRQAALLLIESDMTMLDIALAVGFECLRTFYRAFKNCYQMTPTQYIKNNTQ